MGIYRTKKLIEQVYISIIIVLNHPTINLTMKEGVDHFDYLLLHVVRDAIGGLLRLSSDCLTPTARGTSALSKWIE